MVPTVDAWDLHTTRDELLRIERPLVEMILKVPGKRGEEEEVEVGVSDGLSGRACDRGQGAEQAGIYNGIVVNKASGLWRWDPLWIRIRRNQSKLVITYMPL